MNDQIIFADREAFEQATYTIDAVMKNLPDSPQKVAMQQRFSEMCYWYLEAWCVAENAAYPDPQPHTAPVAVEMEACQNYLRNLGAAWPRSCPTCGLGGQCKYGIEARGPSIFDRPTVREPKGHG